MGDGVGHMPQFVFFLALFNQHLTSMNFFSFPNLFLVIFSPIPLLLSPPLLSPPLSSLLSSPHLAGLSVTLRGSGDTWWGQRLILGHPHAKPVFQLLVPLWLSGPLLVDSSSVGWSSLGHLVATVVEGNVMCLESRLPQTSPE